MRQRKIQFTPQGYQKLQTDFDFLTQKRKGAVVALHTARQMGDLSENGAYKAARFELSDIDRRLRRLTYLLRSGEIAPVKTTSGHAEFGSRVTLVDENKNTLTFILVEGFESNPAEEKISLHSPLGRAVSGRKAGDVVTVHAPAGQKSYTILSIA